MNTIEILSEIKKLPVVEKHNLFKKLSDELHNDSYLTEELREQEFEQMLLAEGVIKQIPPRWNDDDDFEPVKIIGKPLSETIIEDRGK